MSTVYFLGAGSSAADGLPTTVELNHGVAAYLLSARGRSSHLMRYYESVFGIRAKSLEASSTAWKNFLKDRKKKDFPPNPLPSLIETLSVLDLSLSDGKGLGVSRRPGFALSLPSLEIVRSELAMALGTAVEACVSNHRTLLVNRLVRDLAAEDALITTNWDRLLDRALINRQRGRRPHPTACNIDYGCIRERPVDVGGRDVKMAAVRAPLLKLHGSLSWFHCPCCGELYANLEGAWIVDPQARRRDHDYCHCGAGLENFIVVPSYVKDYRNAHIGSVWQRAQRALDRADHWVFIGYSLPPDDYHIRAMLLRSYLVNRSRRTAGQLTITAVLYNPSTEEKARYSDLFRKTKLKIFENGMKDWLVSLPT